MFAPDNMCLLRENDFNSGVFIAVRWQVRLDLDGGCLWNRLTDDPLVARGEQ